MAGPAVETKRQKAFGGDVIQFSHSSQCCNCEMQFTFFMPPGAAGDDGSSKKAALVMFLGGAEATHLTFVECGALETAAARNIALLCPDVGPRGEAAIAKPDLMKGIFVGEGWAYYIDATQEPWSKHYQMFSYVSREIFEVLEATESLRDRVDLKSVGVIGHSAGGFGALCTVFRKRPPDSRFKSISLFAPNCHPTACPIMGAIFTPYLGEDKSEWATYDGVELCKAYDGQAMEILLDQGTEDAYLGRPGAPNAKFPGLVVPDDLADACNNKEGAVGSSKVSVRLRWQEGHKHGPDGFIATFAKDHLEFHESKLR